MRALSIAVMTIALGVAGSGVAAAQQPVTEPIPEGHWSLTPWASINFGGSLNDAAPAVGLATAYNWTSRVAFEADFGVTPSANQGVLIDFDTTLWHLTGNMLYHFAERPFIPYVGAGLGVARGTTDVDPALAPFDLDESTTALVFNLGGGVKRQVTDRTSFRADLRYFTGDDLVANLVRLYVGAAIDLGRR